MAKIDIKHAFRLCPAKIDIKHAFRLCPARPQNFLLLGMHWKGKYYFDTRLPFGGQSSPFIFNNFADALKPGLCLCSTYINSIKHIFSYLGVSIADDKLQGPTTRMVTRLPEEKLIDLKACLTLWVSKRRCTKLSFAAKVVKPGRLFLWRQIDLAKSVHQLHYFLLIDSEAREYILWWNKLDELKDFMFNESTSVFQDTTIYERLANKSIHLLSEEELFCNASKWFMDLTKAPKKELLPFIL